MEPHNSSDARPGTPHGGRFSTPRQNADARQIIPPITKSAAVASLLHLRFTKPTTRPCFCISRCSCCDAPSACLTKFHFPSCRDSDIRIEAFYDNDTRTFRMDRDEIPLCVICPIGIIGAIGILKVIVYASHRKNGEKYPPALRSIVLQPNRDIPGLIRRLLHV